MSTEKKPEWEELIKIAKEKKTLLSLSMKTGEYSLLPDVVEIIKQIEKKAYRKGYVDGENYKYPLIKL